MVVVLSRLSVLLSTCLLLGLISCSAQPPQTAVPPSVSPTNEGNEPTPAAADTAVATGTASPTVTNAPPTAEPTIVPTATESIVEETADAPPFIIAFSRGVFAAAADGSGVSQLLDDSIAIGNQAYGYQTAFSPDGRYLAYSSPSGEPTMLNLLDVHSGEARLLTPLLSAETQPRPEDDCLGAENDSNRCQAAFTVGETAWSPDGQKLAFVSAHAGNSADLYLYTVADQQIIQLSSGDTAASRLFWSPDSQIIFYYGIHFASGSGQEAIMSGWAVQADGSRTVKLHDRLTSQAEIIVGWLDAETIVVYSLDLGFCGVNLRSHNVRTGETTLLWDGLIAADGVALQPDGAMLIEATCSPEEDWLLLLRNSAGEIIPIPEARPFLPLVPHWSAELNVFYAAQAAGWQLFSTGGQVVSYADLAVDRPDTVPPGAVAGSQQWAWAGSNNEGVWLQARIPSSQPDQIFAERVRHLTWNPAGDTLFFLSGRNPLVLYAAKMPEFEATAVTTDELSGPSENILLAWPQP